MNNPSLKAGVRKTPESGIPSIDEFRLYCTSNPDHHEQPQPKGWSYETPEPGNHHEQSQPKGWS